MAAAALLALVHDLVLTLGIYALVGFTVTPATLISVLTILGYSLYDTVVVFDKVQENTRVEVSTTKTYSGRPNLAVGLILVRSINTTVIGVLPVAALLFIKRTVILGEGPLKDLALALFVGMISGRTPRSSSHPLLAQLKEREPEMKKLASRVAAPGQEDHKAQGAQGCLQGFDTVRRRHAGRGCGARRQAHAGPSSRRVTRAAAAIDPEPDEAPSEDAEMADAAIGSRTGIRISRVESGGRPDLRPTSEGAAKRPQPQRKPRSQRKK